MKRRTWIIILIVLLVAAVGYGFTRLLAARRASNTPPQTFTVQRGDLQAIVGSSGTVRAAQSLDLTFGVSGTLHEVFVAVGDEVITGQPLARLDTRSLEAQVASAEVSLMLAQDKLDELKKPATQTEIALAEATLARAQAAYESAKAKPVEWQIAQAEAALEEARQTLEDAQAAYDKVSWRPEIAMMHQSFALQSATEAYEAALDTYRIAMAAVSDADIRSAAAQLAQGQENYDELLAGPSTTNLLSAEAQVTQAQISLDTANLSLEKAILTATFDGTIAEINVVVGQTVAQNTVIMSLADLGSLEADAPLPEVDVVRIVEGQSVELILDAFPDETLTGRVQQIALVGTVYQGVVFYPVTIAINHTTVAARPGMTASISIIVEEKTNVLMVPNRAVRSYGGGRGYYVEGMVEGQIVRVPITIGMTSGSMTEITGGALREGDTVVIASTTATQTNRVSGRGQLIPFVDR